MKLLVAITDSDVVRLFYERTKIKMCYLISYPYLKGHARRLTKVYRPMMDLLYLDSGAYSVFKGASEISISEYSLYLNRYGEPFDEIINLDQYFNDPDLNYRNQIYLEKHLPAGRKRPIPVIHDPHDPFKELRTYVDLGYDYIAVGSNLRSKTDLFENIKHDYPNLKIHLFGDLTRKTLTTYKPYTVDSTTYAQAAKMGFIMYWHPEEKREYQIYLGEREKKEDPKGEKEEGKYFQYKNFKYREKLDQFWKETFNYTHKDLILKTEPKWVVNIYFFKELQDYVNGLT